MSSAGDHQLRLFLVDDHEMVRSAFSRLLNSQTDIVVVGEAASLAEAEKLMPQAQPDLVSLDLDLPGGSGCSSVLSLVRKASTPPVVICSYRAVPEEVVLLVNAGVRGYVTKSSSAGELVDAIRAISQGQTYFCSNAQAAIDEAKERKRSNEELLTPRQLEVLLLAAQGNSTKEIASRLALSAKTVENYRSAILKRLDANNLAHAIARARHLKLLES